MLNFVVRKITGRLEKINLSPNPNLNPGYPKDKARLPVTPRAVYD